MDRTDANGWLDWRFQYNAGLGKMTEETPYLICHKVRGQPAFDVAIKIEGDIWIISTSGHRAYPFWEIPLDNLLFASISPNFIAEQMPPTLPDHYSANDTKPKRMSELTLEDLEL